MTEPSRRGVFAGWWQVVACMLNQAAGPGTIIICFSVIAVALQKEFETSRATLGLIMTLTYLINGVASPVLGASMDRGSIRRILMFGGVLLAAGYLALSFAKSMTQVFVAYGVFLALANAALGPLSYSTLLPRWFIRKRAQAVGITVLGYAVGGLALPPLLQFLIETFGWRDALRLVAAFVIIVVVPTIGWLVIDDPRSVGLNPDGDSQPPSQPAVASAYQSPSTASLLGDLNFWVITLAVGLVLWGAAGSLSNMVPFAVSRGFTAKQGALVLSCFSAGSFTSKVLYSVVGDRLNPRVGLAAGLSFFTVSSFFFLRAYTYPILLIGSFLHGMGVGIALPLWSYLTARAFGTENTGRVFGLMSIVTMPFSLLAPPLLGRIFDRTHAYDDAFILYICLGLSAFLLVPQLRVIKAPQLPATVTN